MKRIFRGEVLFPDMVRVLQKIEAPKIEDVRAETEKELRRIGFSGLIRWGDRVGITVGSRGMAGITGILETLSREVVRAGGKPFVIPAMGSHGGGTEEGRMLVLRSLGVDEKSTGIPIRPAGDAEKIGITESGIPVYVSSGLLKNADRIVLFNRVKSHTEYSGSVESGIHKMCAIGLGNPQGAKSVHEFALDLGYERAILEVSRFLAENLPIACGLATVENYYHEVSHLRAMMPEKFLSEERALLKIAKASTGRLPFERIDLLIADQIGKNISGAGLDTKVVGRIMVYGQQEPQKPDIKRIVVLDISDESHGNAIGIGLADFTVKRVLEKLDRRSTYLNCITAQTPEKGRIPVWFDTDRESIEAALLSIGSVRPEHARVVHVRNTEEVKYVEISKSLLGEAKAREDLEILGSPAPMSFDGEGNLERLSPGT